jgi:hypothetical protein
MNVASPTIDMSAASQGQNLLAGSRLIIGIYNDPGLVNDPTSQPATGGPGETYGTPDPVTTPELMSGGITEELGTPDPVSAFNSASGWQDMRLITEPIGVSPFALGAVGNLIQQTLNSPESLIGIALSQAMVDRFVGAMAGFVSQAVGIESLIPSHGGIEPTRVQIAANLGRE